MLLIYYVCFHRLRSGAASLAVWVLSSQPQLTNEIAVFAVSRLNLLTIS